MVKKIAHSIIDFEPAFRRFWYSRPTTKQVWRSNCIDNVSTSDKKTNREQKLRQWLSSAALYRRPSNWWVLHDSKRWGWNFHSMKKLEPSNFIRGLQIAMSTKCCNGWNRRCLLCKRPCTMPWLFKHGIEPHTSDTWRIELIHGECKPTQRSCD